jgi:hypothetical protein
MAGVMGMYLAAEAVEWLSARPNGRAAGAGRADPRRGLRLLRMSRLLPQPQGFKGFGLLRELVHSDDLAVAEREDVV